MNKTSLLWFVLVRIAVMFLNTSCNIGDKNTETVNETESESISDTESVSETESVTESVTETETAQVNGNSGITSGGTLTGDNFSELHRPPKY